MQTVFFQQEFTNLTKSFPPSVMVSDELFVYVF